MGRAIAEALACGCKGDKPRYRYSFDMLGEAALTRDDADRYLQAYHDAIAAIGRNGPFENEISAPSISVKLSALHPRYEHARSEEHTSDIQSLMRHSYAVFYLTKKQMETSR